MSWRPDRWDNPYPDLTEKALTEKYLLRAMEEQKSNYEIFEAGADAMLGALRKTGDHYEVGRATLKVEIKEAGRLVIIPDDTP